MLENLPETFLLQLADIDPGMISKKLHNSCGTSITDAWKFVTSRARYRLAISRLATGGNAFQGIQSVAYAKAASGDEKFTFMDPGIHCLFTAVYWACWQDNIRILSHCFAALPLDRIPMRKKSHIIWGVADRAGSKRVLHWFLVNHPDILHAAIPFISGDHTETVKWCIQNRKSVGVNWVLMKVNAVFCENTEAMNLLDWVDVPPCTPLCGGDYACMVILITSNIANM